MLTQSLVLLAMYPMMCGQTIPQSLSLGGPFGIANDALPMRRCTGNGQCVFGVFGRRARLGLQQFSSAFDIFLLRLSLPFCMAVAPRTCRCLWRRLCVTCMPLSHLMINPCKMQTWCPTLSRLQHALAPLHEAVVSALLCHASLRDRP